MSSEDPLQDTTSSFPGNDFTEARESLGLSFEQLTRELRLPVPTLKAIEAGDLNKLGGPVFIRGYIRAYARRLKLNPDTYVAHYDRLAGIKDVASSVRTVGSLSTSQARQSRSLMRVGTFLFIVAIIAIIIWWWQTQYSIDSVIVSPNDAPVTVDTADGNTLVLPSVDGLDTGLPEVGSTDVGVAGAGSPNVEVPSVVSPEGDSMQEPSVDELLSGEEGVASAAIAAEQSVNETVGESEADGGVVPTSPEADDSGNAAESGGLHIVLTEESWLSVKDASGRSLFNGIARPGSDLELNGVEPLSIVIGRASAVSSIEYSGEPVDLDSVTNKNVARLTLPASQR